MRPILVAAFLVAAVSAGAVNPIAEVLCEFTTRMAEKLPRQVENPAWPIV